MVLHSSYSYGKQSISKRFQNDLGTHLGPCKFTVACSVSSFVTICVPIMAVIISNAIIN